MKGDHIDEYARKLEKLCRKMAHESDEDKAKIMAFGFAAMCTVKPGRFNMTDVIMLMLMTVSMTHSFIMQECSDDCSKADARDYVMLQAGCEALAQIMDVGMPDEVRKLMGHKIDKSRGLISAALEAQRVLQRAKGRSAS